MRSKRPTIRDVKQARESGYDRARFESLERIEKLERENKRLNDEVKKTELEALRAICQGGSLALEAMSKAFLSYKGHL